jgi:arylsulfatase A-like enzyme
MKTPLAMLALVAATATAAEPPASKPNIVVILADDMGFSDAGCYGGEIATPNIDALAAGGLRFTQFYNTARCWPSRACLLTGYYAQAVRRDSMPGIKGGIAGVRPPWARLLPEYLKALGYRCYHSGKWHVDGRPLANGFDHSFEVNAKGQDNYFLSGATDDGRPVPQTAGYYATTAIADHAIGCLRQHAAKYPRQPFFTYCAFTSPHFPLQAPAADIALYRDAYRAGWDELRQHRYDRTRQLGIVACRLSPLEPQIWPSYNLSEPKMRALIGPGEMGRAGSWETLSVGQKEFQPVKMAIHAAMVHRMDTEIGRVIGQLKAMNVLDNTAIFFLSDNGASAEQIIRGGGHDPTAPPGSAKTFLCLGPGWSSAANTPLRLHKSWVHEGGISTPLVVHWPAGIKARGQLRRNPGHIADLAPTILELAGGQWPRICAGKPVPSPHGKSLVPAFTHDGAAKHDYFWWYHVGNRALRVGDWKIVACTDGPWELYNLREDRSETQNLAAAQPERVRELQRLWTQCAEKFRALAQPEPSAASKPK